ncbi:hypothetical protein SAMN04490202_4534 [Pseudomonas reinekei]|uniref:Uncharacterized protein n=2 Tax=Pseudomonas reinekei TaxID=395598 RepID=A0A1H0T8G4_PSERE|nr:hypothetical protein SAMN04490202_4534 [Pseudomonas reinekei]
MGHLGGIGWLSGRHRQQAGSHNLGGVYLGEIGWLSGCYRQQAGSYSRSEYTRALHHSTGRALARLQLLILTLIHPPPREAEWRCSSGDWRSAPFDAVELIACRCSEANRRAMPPDECRSEGTPSLSEGPDARGEPFFAYFFLAFEKKVSRRKGETASGRYQRNGYVRRPPPIHPKAIQKTNTTHHFVFDIKFRIAYKVLHAPEQIQGGN